MKAFLAYQHGVNLMHLHNLENYRRALPISTRQQGAINEIRHSWNKCLRLCSTLSQKHLADFSGLSNFYGLNRAIEELEKSLMLDTQIEEKMFNDRTVASVAFLPLDTIWMCQSMFIEKQSGVRNVIDYLESKMRLLDYLGDVNLPGTCFMLYTHYMHYLESETDPSTYYFHRADDWLKRAANRETYEDVAKGTMFCIASLHYKKQAQEKLTLHKDLEYRTNQAMGYFQEALKSKAQRDYDKAIKELDESIVFSTENPLLMEINSDVAGVAMSAYFELAAVILLKFNLLNKANLSDDEFLWFGRATRCAKKEIEIYDKYISGTSLANDKLELYKKAKQLASMELRFLTYERNGRTLTRKTEILDAIVLPTIRCLAQEETEEMEVRKRISGHYSAVHLNATKAQE
jgi:hypothetical protein